MLKSRTYTVLVVIFLLLCPIFSNAQNERFIDPYFENYTTTDRLPFDKFYDGLIDEEGFAWFACLPGIIKFDGYEFEAFKNKIGEEDALLEGGIVDILLDKYGYMWIGGKKGLSRWDRKTGEIIHLQKDLEKYPFKGIRSGTLTLGPEGNVWVSSRLFLNKVNVDDLSIESWDIRPHFSLPQVNFTSNKISWDKKDSNLLWIGSDYGLLKFNIKNETFEYFLTPFFLKNKDELGLKYDFHTHVYADSSGTIYTGRIDKSIGLSRNEGMHAFDPATEKWRVIKLPPEGTVQSISGISYKAKDELWIETTYHGLGIFNTVTEKFIFIDHDKNDRSTISHNRIRFKLMDSMQNLIIGTGDALSISHQQRNIFKDYRLLPKDLVERRPSISVTDVLEKDSTFYIATSDGVGLVIVDKKTREYKEIPLHKKKSPFGNSMSELMEDHLGVIYIATNAGLMVYDKNKDEIEEFKTTSGDHLSLTNPKIYKVIEDKSDQLWIGTENEGLIKITAGRDSVLYFRHNKDDENSLVVDGEIRGLELDNRERLWISTSRGVSCYDQDKNEFINYSDEEKGDQRIATNFAFNTLTDTLGRIWMGSFLLVCLDESKEKGEQQELFTIKDGLPGTYVRTMQRHPDGTFWLVTDDGFAHFNPYNRQIKTYTTKEGLGSDQMWDHNFYFSDDHVRIYNKTGYYEYQPGVEEGLIKANIAFTGFEIKGKEVEGMTEINGLDTLRLEHLQNFVAFKYAMLNFAPKMDNMYSYKLEGLDENWVDAGKRRFAQYTDLKGGYYTFKVKAKDRLGNEAKNVLTKTIFIATPFWKTAWFKALIALVIAIICYMIYRSRIATIEKEKSLMARLAENEMIALRAQMNPHFLFNTINSIKRFIIKNETTIAADHLTKFSRLVRLILNNSNNRSIPLNDEMEALRLYIEMELMRFDNKFDYSIDIDKDLDLETLEIPPMLMQPFVENAIWHGLMHKDDGKGLLTVKLRGLDGYLECIIEDNGVGRAKAGEIKSKSAIKKKSLGMTLTQRRIELLDQFSKDKIINLEILDLVNEDGDPTGTRVTIRIPFDNQS